MKVVLDHSVEFALRTLGEDARLTFLAWFDHLADWENDEFVREHSQKLPNAEGVYALKAGMDYWIFFELHQDRIVVLDIASDETIRRFRQASANVSS